MLGYTWRERLADWISGRALFSMRAMASKYAALCSKRTKLLRGVSDD